MKLKPWAKMPTAWIQAEGLHRFDWKTDGSTGTVALMIYYVMCQFAAERPLRPGELPEPPTRSLPPPRPLPIEGEPVVAGPAWALSTPGSVAPNPAILGGALPPWMSPATEGQAAVQPNLAFTQISAPGWGANRPVDPAVTNGEVTALHVPDSLIVRITYDDLAAMTGRSRERISAGLEKLIAIGMIWRVDKSSTYGLCGHGPGKRWVKLPGRALVSHGSTTFLPYTHFKLRSKDELNALKLHFYYAHTRDGIKSFSAVSYPTIHARTGIRLADIPRANTLLVSTGILQRTRGLPGEDVKAHESNKYYLAGYDELNKQKMPAAPRPSAS